MRAEATDEAFEHDLEDGGCDEGVEESEHGVVDVPEGADADLHQEDDDDGDEGGEHGCCPDWDDFFTKGIGELGVDDVAVGKSNGE